MCARVAVRRFGATRSLPTRRYSMTTTGSSRDAAVPATAVPNAAAPAAPTAVVLCRDGLMLVPEPARRRATMKVAVLDDYLATLPTLDCFAKLAGHDVTVWNDHTDDVDVLAARLHDADALVLIRERTKVTGA